MRDLGPGHRLRAPDTYPYLHPATGLLEGHDGATVDPRDLLRGRSSLDGARQSSGISGRVGPSAVGGGGAEADDTE